MSNPTPTTIQFAADEPTQTLTPLQTPTRVNGTATELSQLTENIGFARSAVGVLNETITDIHQRLRDQLLQARAGRIREPGAQLLEELSDLGFAWRHIALLIGVTVPSVQKWRKGETVSPDNLDRIATLMAICDLLSDNFIGDVPAWFEIRIVPDIPIRPMDFYIAGRNDLLLDWASQHQLDATRLLNDFDPDWQRRYDSDFEVFEADDGGLAARFKGSK